MIGRTDADKASAGMLQEAYGWAIVAAWCVVLLSLPLLEPSVVRDRAWAFDHLLDVPLWARLGLAAAACAFCSRRFQARCVTLAARPAAIARSVMPSRSFAAPAVGVLLFGALWMLRNRNFDLGDSAALLFLVERQTRVQGYNLTFDEPLELLVHSGLYRVLNLAFGAGVETTYALVSCVCGVVFVFVAKRFVDGFGLELPRRNALLALLLSMGSSQLFFGHVENYTITMLMILVYVSLARGYLLGRVAIAAPAMALGVAFSLHILSGWLLPSLLYLVCSGLHSRGIPGLARDAFVAALAFLGPVVATVVLGLALGETMRSFENTHVYHLYFVFLVEERSPFFHFGFLSLGHVTAIANQLMLVSLPGLLALGQLGLFHRSASVFRDPFVRFVAIAAVFFQLFAMTWNPNIGPYRDFDLFSFVGLGYGLLAVSWAAVLPSLDDRSLHALRSLVFVGMSQALTFVVVNHVRIGLPSV